MERLDTQIDTLSKQEKELADRLAQQERLSRGAKELCGVVEHQLSPPTAPGSSRASVAVMEPES